MSVKNLEVAFSAHCHHGRRWKFTGIRELGFNERGGFVIDAWTTPAVVPGEPRGGYFTSIPISPIDYRRAHATPAAFDRHGTRRLVVFDDWNMPHVIDAPRSVIDALVAECEANDVRARPGARRTRTP